ncbi:hypothetical protein [Idiomarina abyssalis]|uniref:Uncharacterized protein n=1 Tax=Idiomarina abyssalis TaxID=86102 RepID=A0A8I1G6R0_9GAMM|nr:hypothetical protein [Idiomarina abyssalis]MBJ7265443.1 hypothetical protein [Idiomarina abyssalis]MBJ7316883.1 hypothetical protein [Idiomarina abyssalis]
MLDIVTIAMWSLSLAVGVTLFKRWRSSGSKHLMLAVVSLLFIWGISACFFWLLGFQLKAGIAQENQFGNQWWLSALTLMLTIMSDWVFKPKQQGSLYDSRGN